MKIAVIGYSGSGKSTLAKALSEKYDLPLLYLDRIRFQENWAERSDDEALPMVEHFMENKDWVIDGNYRSYLQVRRLREADKIVFLNFPRLVCYRQAKERYKENKGKSRESIANGCAEKLDFAFLWWILFGGRTAGRRAGYRDIIQKYPGKVIELRSRAEVNRFLEVGTI